LRGLAVTMKCKKSLGGTYQIERRSMIQKLIMRKKDEWLARS